MATTLNGIEYCYLHTGPTVTPLQELKDEVISQLNPKAQNKAEGKSSLVRLVNFLCVHVLIFHFPLLYFALSHFDLRVSLLGVSQGTS